jgi:hypothetical protein
MKRLSIRIVAVTAAVTAVFMTTLGVHGQQPTQGAHSLDEGTWALQFAIGDNLTLGEFAGGVISAKHSRADGRALRYGLTVSAGHTSGRDDAPDRTDAMVGLVAHFLRYPTLARDPGSNLHMFWGVGPLVRFQHQRATRPAGDDFTFRTLFVGAGGTIGAEWFLRPRMSLTAEYQTALLARFASEPAPDEWAVRLAPDGVRFGVSVYFR